MAKTYEWAQGADLTIRLNYKEGSTAQNAQIVDLSNGYAVRMDLVIPGTKTVVYTFNSEDIQDTDPVTPGDQTDTNKEATLSNGAGGMGNVAITVPRSLTLPGGAIYERMYDADEPSTAFEFDIFLRNTGTDKQHPIHDGLIIVSESKTLWA